MRKGKLVSPVAMIVVVTAVMIVVWGVFVSIAIADVFDAVMRGRSRRN